MKNTRKKNQLKNKIVNGGSTPQQIDDFVFNYEIIGIKNKPCKIKSQKSKVKKSKS